MKRSATSMNMRDIREDSVPDWIYTEECQREMCPHCDALRFCNEPRGHCCGNGRIKLPEPKMPEELMRLYEKKDFRTRIRRYNNSNAFTSMGCDDEIVQKNGWTPNVKIRGNMYHRISAIQPEPGQQPKFGQIFFYDQDEVDEENRREKELKRRIEVSKGPTRKGKLSHHNDGNPSLVSNLNVDDMRIIQDVLHKVNPFVHSYKAVLQLDPNTITEKRLVLRRDKKPSRAHNRTYNMPQATNEIAIITKDDKLEPSDIIVHKKGGGIWRISEWNRCYDPLHYVLLFPHGEDGWHGDMWKGGRRISPTQFYNYRFQIRPNESNNALHGAKLTQQYMCDTFYKSEKWKLNWVKSKKGQKQCKAEKYSGLHDAISNDEDLKRKGTRIVCPPSIIGSPRWYVEQFQDAMAVVRNYGKVRKLILNVIFLNVSTIQLVFQATSVHHFHCHQ